MPGANGIVPGIIPPGLLSSKFWVEVSGILEASFSDCQGLEVHTEIFEYREGGVNTHTHKLPGRTIFSNITLKRGLTTSDKFWQWYLKTTKGEIEKKNISIILYSGNQAGIPIKRWDITGAYPIKWSGSDLKSTDSQSFLVETVELVHEGFNEVQVG
jgi:phage tail-like protein